MNNRGYHKFKCEKIFFGQVDYYVKSNLNGGLFYVNFDLKPSKLPNALSKIVDKTYFAVLALTINMLFESNFTPIISHNQMNLLLTK